MHHREDPPGDGQRGIERQAKDHIADLTYDMERQDTPKLILCRRPEHARDHGQGRAPKQYVLEVA